MILSSTLILDRSFRDGAIEQVSSIVCGASSQLPFELRQMHDGRKCLAVFTEMTYIVSSGALNSTHSLTARRVA